MTTEPLFTIGQLSRRVGVPVKTIRYWSDEGVLPVARRSAAGYRLYDLQAVARLELVATLRELGLGLETIAEVLRQRSSLAEVAQAHVLALDERIALMQWQRSVLRVIAERSASTKETQLMHALTKLSASERQALVDEFVDRAFAGVDANHPAAGIAHAMRALPPELPQRPSSAQIEAWIELAGLISDAAFAARVREMALASNAGDSTPGIDPAQVRALVQPALDQDVDPSSKQARDIVQQLLPTNLDSAGRAALSEQLERFSDRRVERYWALLACLNDRPAHPAMVPLFEWVIAVLRASEFRG